MKVSVSLPPEDVEFLDEYARRQGFDSRSAVLHKAVRLLHSVQLGDAYESAWSEWAEQSDAELWDAATADTGSN